MSLKFWYRSRSGGEEAGEVLRIESRHGEPGVLPTFLSEIALREDDNESHTSFQRTKRPASSEDEAHILLSAIEALNAERISASL